MAVHSTSVRSHFMIRDRVGCQTCYRCRRRRERPFGDIRPVKSQPRNWHGSAQTEYERPDLVEMY